MDQTALTFIVAGATLATVILGVVIDVSRGYLRNRRSGKRVRRMLALELVQNLEVVEECWDSVKQFYLEGLQSRPHTNTPHQVAKEISDYPELRWQTKVFEALIEQLPFALEDEEISEVLRFFARLDELSSIQAQLSEQVGALDKRQHEPLPGTVILTGGTVTERDIDIGVRILDISRLANKFRTIAERLIERGSPLQPNPAPEAASDLPVHLAGPPEQLSAPDPAPSFRLDGRQSLIDPVPDGTVGSVDQLGRASDVQQGVISKVRTVERDRGAE